MLGEIAFVEQSVALLHIGDDRARDRTLVKGVAPAAGNLLQGRGEVGIGEDLARLRRPSGGQKRRRGGGIGGELPLAVLPLPGDDLGHGKAVFRVFDRGRDGRGHRHGPSSDQPSTTPGTVTDSTPALGTRVSLRAAKTSAVAA